MRRRQAFSRRRIYLGLLLVFGGLAAVLAVLIPLIDNANDQTPREGEVAAVDYRAPRATTYVSEIRTELRRNTQAAAVAPIYTPPDTRVARRQMEQLRSALAFITSVRGDPYATPEQKIKDLGALEEIRLSPATARTVLQVSDARWQEIQQGALTVLEQIMSAAIRSETLGDTLLRVPSRVSLSFTEDHAAVVAELAAAFVAPNSQYSEELTLAARQAARDAVEPVTRTFIAGQTVALRGEVLDAEDIEALQRLGLVQPARSGRELTGAILLTVTLVLLVLFYARRKTVLRESDLRKIATLAALWIVFLSLARLIIPAHAIVPYAFPLVTYGLVAAAIFGLEVALVTSVPLSILAAYALPNVHELTLYYLISGFIGVLILGKARRLSSFIMAGIGISLAGMAVILVYRLPQTSTDTTGLMQLGGAAILSGLTSASVGILLYSLLSQFLGTVTPMQLMELTRPDQPLLRKLLIEAPGTYQHSLQVANLAEQAAERIGADALLTRVGALYHDIGKSDRPIFFIENQPAGFANPHDNLSPQSSAHHILQHIVDGVELGRRNRLPQRILDFIAEHHGTGVTSYQYNRALKENGKGEVDLAQFRYPGPRPRSRETAILMLADGSEARVRAEKPETEEQMRRIIDQVIKSRVESGQLDDTDLTLSDLRQIADSFFVTLRGFYHPRLDYSKVVQSDEPETPEQATTPPGLTLDMAEEAEKR